MVGYIFARRDPPDDAANSRKIRYAVEPVSGQGRTRFDRSTYGTEISIDPSFAARSITPVTRARDVQSHALAVGDKIPSGTFKHFNSEGNMKELTTEQLFKGKS